MSDTTTPATPTGKCDKATCTEVYSDSVPLTWLTIRGRDEIPNPLFGEAEPEEPETIWEDFGKRHLCENHRDIFS